MSTLVSSTFKTSERGLAIPSSNADLIPSPFKVSPILFLKLFIVASPFWAIPVLVFNWIIRVPPGPIPGTTIILLIVSQVSPAFLLSESSNLVTIP